MPRWRDRSGSRFRSLTWACAYAVAVLSGCGVARTATHTTPTQLELTMLSDRVARHIAELPLDPLVSQEVLEAPTFSASSRDRSWRADAHGRQLVLVAMESGERRATLDFDALIIALRFRDDDRALLVTTDEGPAWIDLARGRLLRPVARESPWMEQRSDAWTASGDAALYAHADSAADERPSTIVLTRWNPVSGEQRSWALEVGPHSARFGALLSISVAFDREGGNRAAVCFGNELFLADLERSTRTPGAHVPDCNALSLSGSRVVVMAAGEALGETWVSLEARTATNLGHVSARSERFQTLARADFENAVLLALDGMTTSRIDLADASLDASGTEDAPRPLPPPVMPHHVVVRDGVPMWVDGSLFRLDAHPGPMTDGELDALVASARPLCQRMERQRVVAIAPAVTLERAEGSVDFVLVERGRRTPLTLRNALCGADRVSLEGALLVAWRGAERVASWSRRTGVAEPWPTTCFEHGCRIAPFSEYVLGQPSGQLMIHDPREHGTTRHLRPATLTRDHSRVLVAPPGDVPTRRLAVHRATDGQHLGALEVCEPLQQESVDAVVPEWANVVGDAFVVACVDSRTEEGFFELRDLASGIRRAAWPMDGGEQFFSSGDDVVVTARRRRSCRLGADLALARCIDPALWAQGSLELRSARNGALERTIEIPVGGTARGILPGSARDPRVWIDTPDGVEVVRASDGERMRLRLVRTATGNALLVRSADAFELIGGDGDEVAWRSSPPAAAPLSDAAARATPGLWAAFVTPAQ